MKFIYYLWNSILGADLQYFHIALKLDYKPALTLIIQSEYLCIFQKRQ